MGVTLTAQGTCVHKFVFIVLNSVLLHIVGKDKYGMSEDLCKTRAKVYTT